MCVLLIFLTEAKIPDAVLHVLSLGGVGTCTCPFYFPDNNYYHDHDIIMIEIKCIRIHVNSIFSYSYKQTEKLMTLWKCTCYKSSPPLEDPLQLSVQHMQSETMSGTLRRIRSKNPSLYTVSCRLRRSNLCTCRLIQLR